MITVEITKQDLKNGVANNSKECALALALRRKYPRQGIGVGSCTVQVGTMHLRCMEDAEQFVIEFDKHAGVGMNPQTVHLQ